MRRWIAILLVVTSGGTSAFAADQSVSSQDANGQPVALGRIITSIPDGTAWATFLRKGKGLFDVECWPLPNRIDKLVWHPGDVNIDRRKYLSDFASELKNAGFTPADDPENLFQKNRGEADLQVAANIKGINAKLCLGYSGTGLYIGAPGAKAPDPKPDLDRIYGDIEFDIDWQIYSKAADKVVADLEIKSSFSPTGHVQGNYERLVEGGIRENFKSLIAAPAFKTAVAARPSPSTFSVDTQAKIRLATTQQSKALPISDAIGSVMVIFSSGGHGSGFLASSDGYVVTAAHVVGSDKYIKVRWSDGLEGVGEVVRTNSRRDVALIKTDPRGRQPLALRREAPQPGDTVFAIGAPIDPKLQNTVTRGVVSANRIMDGFSFIQSDVTVDPGNSGGPLLDEQGRVLGFTDKGLRSAEAPTGLNFFVPIDDALRFLSAEPQ